MLSQLDDTIAAIASAGGAGARGIVRLSGPRVLECLATCFRPLAEGATSLPWIDADRSGPSYPMIHTGHCEVPRPGGGWASIPCDLFLWPTARSYTRQPAAELHTVGSPPLLDAILQSLYRGGARLAQPGEFTLRAFLAGRIDLVQAEAVLGVVDAQDGGQLEAALRQLAGGLSRPLTQLRDDLLELLVELEAGLDFPDEDIAFIAADEVLRRLDEAGQRIRALADQLQNRTETHATVRAVLAGPPNVGKSSLFNALAMRYAAGPAMRYAAGPRPQRHEIFGSDHALAGPAIVASQPGTTRDYLTVRLDLDGIDCDLVDTAGIEVREYRLAAGPATEQPDLESAARQAAREQQRQADIVLDCVPAQEPSESAGTTAGAFPISSSGTDLSEFRGSDRTATAGVPLPTPDRRPGPPDRSGSYRIEVRTKADLLPGDRATESATGCGPAITTSVRTGQGIDALGDAIRHHALARTIPSGDAVAATAGRCRESLAEAAEDLARAARVAARDGGDELVAAEVRAAVDCLGQVVGAVYTEDLLDRIFSSFCLGK